MAGLLRRHPLPAYFVLAYAITWLIWAPLALEALGVWRGAVLPYHHYVGALGPITAAVIVTAWAYGSTGLRELGSRLIRWRVRWWWYAAAILGPALVLFAAAAIVRARTGIWVDFGLVGASEEFPQLGLLGVFAVNTLTFGIGEEVGWRGFALPRLQARRTALRATLWLTLAWAPWHLPAFWYRPGYASMDVPGIVGFLFSLATGAILLTWLYNSSGGSLLIAILFHGSINVVFNSQIATGATVNTMGALVMVWAVLVVISAGTANLSRLGSA